METRTKWKPLTNMKDLERVVLKVVKKNPSFFGADYQILKLAKGQTESIKMIIRARGNDYFLKAGDKVERENAMYQLPNFKGDLFLEPIQGLNMPSNFILLPFIKGETLDEVAFISDISVGRLCDLLKKVLDQTAERLWLNNFKGKEFQSPNLVESLLNERMASLKEVEVGEKAHFIKFENLSNFPINYYIGDDVYKLPSIKQMVSEVSREIKKYNSNYVYSITGDFQPTNIIMGNDREFKIIDLSNAIIGGDIAFDIGKFFNFFNRFYFVSFLRDYNKVFFEKNSFVKIDNGVIEAHFYPHKDLEKSYLVNVLEEEFVRNIAVRTKDYNLPDRVKLNKFVVNLITIKRHLRHTKLVDLLFIALFDSYLEVSQKVKTL